MPRSVGGGVPYHHYSHEVVTAFPEDSLFLVDQSIPTQERIDAAVKRVKK